MTAWAVCLWLATGQAGIPESGSVQEFANAYAKALDMKVRVDASLSARRLLILNDDAPSKEGLEFVARVAGGKLVDVDDGTYRVAAVPVSKELIKTEEQFYRTELERHFTIPGQPHEKQATYAFLRTWMHGLSGEEVRNSPMQEVRYSSNEPSTFQAPFRAGFEPEVKRLSDLIEAGALANRTDIEEPQYEPLGKVVIALFRHERGFHASADFYDRSTSRIAYASQNVPFGFARLPLNTKPFSGAEWGDVEVARLIAPVLFHSYQQPWKAAPLRLSLEAAADPLATLARPLGEALKKGAKLRRFGAQMPDGWVVSLAKAHMRAMTPVETLTLLHSERGVTLQTTAQEAIVHPTLSDSRAEKPFSRAAARTYLASLERAKVESLGDLFGLVHLDHGFTVLRTYVRLLARAMGYSTWDSPLMVGATVAALLPPDVSLSTTGMTTVPGFRFRDHVGIMRMLEGEATSFSELPSRRYTHRARPSESPPTTFRMVHLNADPYQAGGPRRQVVFLETSIPGRTVSTHFVAERALP